MTAALLAIASCELAPDTVREYAVIMAWLLGRRRRRGE